MPSQELLESSFDGISINDFIVKINHMADEAETHPAFQGDLPEYVSKAPKLRQIAEGLGLARDAAAGHDRNRLADKKALMAAGKQAVNMNACHIVMLSIVRNDPNILLNAGFEPKQKSNKVTVDLLNHVPEVFPKHTGTSGCISITIKRLKNTASVELQMTDQDPSLEASWILPGMMYNKSRIVMKGLTPAAKINLRSRYHVDGCTGRWSVPVELVII